MSSQLTHLSSRLEALEDRLSALETAGLGLAGVFIGAVATGLMLLRRRATFSTIAASRIQLVAPSGQWRVPDKLMAELSSVGGGRSELVMHGGAVLLTRADRAPALQLDAAWRPLARASHAPADAGAPPQPPQQAPEQLRHLQQAPGLVMYAVDGTPLGALGAQRGWEALAGEAGVAASGEAGGSAGADAAAAGAVGTKDGEQQERRAPAAPPGLPTKAPRAFDFTTAEGGGGRG